jgi:energy-coupling factor transport system permease protein
MKRISFDPRTKLFVVLCLSTAAVAFPEWQNLLKVTLVGIGFGWVFSVPFASLLRRFSRILTVFFGLILVQSLFTNQGEAILQIARIPILTTVGLERGLAYLFRVVIILLSGSILATSSMRDLLQALQQLKLPYVIGLMTAIGVKFLPIFVAEVQDAFVAMQLRGIDVKHLKLRKRIQVIAYLFIPLILSTLDKAERLAATIESRGFRTGAKRSHYRKLKLRRQDLICMMIVPMVMLLTRV